MNVLVLCPAKTATGGPETLHKLVGDLNGYKDVSAKILYVGKDLSNPQPEVYKTYRAPYITEFPTGYEGVVIVPEIWANNILDPKYRNCKKAIFWLSVDNYKKRVSKADEDLCFKDKSILHMTQSFYVEEYVRGLGAKRVFPISEPVNKEFFRDYRETQRSNVVLYNPAKMTKFQEQLMKEATIYEDIYFKPLKGLTIEQMADELRTHKLYIDFGPFPGRERIPREAVLCGCCLITGKNGASQYFKDIPILSKYKFESENSNIGSIIAAMKHILQNYETCRPDFDYFRSILRDEWAGIIEIIGELREVLNEI